MRNRAACNAKYWNLINDYVDQRLKGKKLQALEAHLSACAPCRQAREELAWLRQQLAEMAVPSASAGFWETCRQAIAASAGPRRRLGVRVWRPALAVILTGIVIGLLMWLPSGQQPATLLAPPQKVAPAETSDAEYVMQHEAFAAIQPLGTTSHHVLLSARAAEKNKDLGGAGTAQSADLLCDADTPGN